MVNKKIIPHLKSCCIALGLTKKDQAQPVTILGSGFIIDPEGFFITADHVVTCMEEARSAYLKKGIEVDYRGFLFENVDNEHGQLVSIKIQHGRGLQIIIPELKEHIPEDQDIHVGRLSGKNKLPYLNFDRPTKIEVFDEIFMCGYPRGVKSLRTQSQFSGNSYSPILQYGRIASLLPTDHSHNPYGIQTDIIGTGGSSGSPIVDAESERVLGIAQNVIPSSVKGIINSENASAKIGLIWGISNYFSADPITKMLKVLKSEFDESGIPLSADKLPKETHLTDIFYPEEF